MVEIALALGVIAFAMVAIMGVLPIGLRVQKDNKEETTVLLDGTYFLEAIRSGAKGMDDLTNYVESIIISNYARFGGTRITRFHRSVNSPLYTANDSIFTNGFQIVGLLSTPRQVPAQPFPASNSVTAYVRAIAGNAAIRALSSTNRDFGFYYLMTSEVSPVWSLPPGISGYTNFTLNSGNAINLANSNRWRHALQVSSNLHDIRLTFQWPVFVRDQPRPRRPTISGNRKVYRTQVSGRLVRTNLARSPQSYYFFEPSTFVQATNRP